jgi:ABC-type glycerol-3-phosphate transport system substrate-binding protein
MKRTWMIGFTGLVLGVGVVAQSTLSGPLIFNSNQSDPTPKAFDQKVVALFQKKYPKIDMQFTTVEHESFQDAAIRTYLAADKQPDVLTWFAGNRMRAFSDKGLAADISDVWKTYNLEKYMAKGFQAMSKDSSGKYVFVPTSYYWWAVYYRKDIFKKLKLKEPQTWDQLINTCDVLVKNGIVPFTTGFKQTWPSGGIFDFLDMRTNGPQFHIDLTDGKIPYTDPRVKKVFTNWRQLLDHKCFIKNAASYTWEQGADQMIQGDAAMYLIGDFVRDHYPKERQDAELDFFRFPIIDPKLPVGEEAPTDGFFMPTKASNPANAKAFLGFLASKEVANLAVENLGRLVTRNDVNKKLYKPYIQKGLKNIINKADVIAQFYDRDTNPEMARIGMDGFVEFYSNPDAIDSILEKLEVARQRIFAK